MLNSSNMTFQNVVYCKQLIIFSDRKQIISLNATHFEIENRYSLGRIISWTGVSDLLYALMTWSRFRFQKPYTLVCCLKTKGISYLLWIRDRVCKRYQANYMFGLYHRICWFIISVYFKKKVPHDRRCLTVWVKRRIFIYAVSWRRKVCKVWQTKWKIWLNFRHSTCRSGTSEQIITICKQNYAYYDSLSLFLFLQNLFFSH